MKITWDQVLPIPVLAVFGATYPLKTRLEKLALVTVSLQIYIKFYLVPLVLHSGTLAPI